MDFSLFLFSVSLIFLFYLLRVSFTLLFLVSLCNMSLFYVVVIIIAIMTFPASFNMYLNLLGWFQLHDFFSPSLHVIFSWSLESLVIFDWMPDSVNIIMLSARYFCIHITILDVCSGIRLSGNSLIFSDMAFRTC